MHRALPENSHLVRVSITVQPTSNLTGLDSTPLLGNIYSYLAEGKPVKMEVNHTVIFPPTK